MASQTASLLNLVTIKTPAKNTTNISLGEAVCGYDANLSNDKSYPIITNAYLNVINVSENFVELQWEPATSSTPVYYQVYAFSINKDSVKSTDIFDIYEIENFKYTYGSTGVFKIISVWDPSTSRVIKELLADRAYYFYVIAKNDNELKAIYARSPKVQMGVPFIQNAYSSQSKIITVIDSQETSVTLSWNPAVYGKEKYNDNENSVYYKIEVFKTDSTDSIQETQTEETTITVKDLYEGQTVSVKVTAISLNDDGKKTEYTDLENIKLLSNPPQLTDPTVWVDNPTEDPNLNIIKANTSTSVCLKWYPAADPSGPVEYAIYYDVGEDQDNPPASINSENIEETEKIKKIEDETYNAIPYASLFIQQNQSYYAPVQVGEMFYKIIPNLVPGLNYRFYLIARDQAGVKERGDYQDVNKVLYNSVTYATPALTLPSNLEISIHEINKTESTSTFTLSYYEISSNNSIYYFFYSAAKMDNLRSTNSFGLIGNIENASEITIEPPEANKNNENVIYYPYLIAQSSENSSLALYAPCEKINLTSYTSNNAEFTKGKIFAENDNKTVSAQIKKADTLELSWNPPSPPPPPTEGDYVYTLYTAESQNLTLTELQYAQKIDLTTLTEQDNNSITFTTSIAELNLPSERPHYFYVVVTINKRSNCYDVTTALRFKDVVDQEENLLKIPYPLISQLKSVKFEVEVEGTKKIKFSFNKATSVSNQIEYKIYSHSRSDLNIPAIEKIGQAEVDSISTTMNLISNTIDPLASLTNCYLYIIAEDIVTHYKTLYTNFDDQIVMVEAVELSSNQIQLKWSSETDASYYKIKYRYRDFKEKFYNDSVSWPNLSTSDNPSWSDWNSWGVKEDITNNEIIYSEKNNLELGNIYEFYVEAYDNDNVKVKSFLKSIPILLGGPILPNPNTLTAIELKLPDNYETITNDYDVVTLSWYAAQDLNSQGKLEFLDATKYEICYSISELTKEDLTKNIDELKKEEKIKVLDKEKLKNKQDLTDKENVHEIKITLTHEDLTDLFQDNSNNVFYFYVFAKDAVENTSIYKSNIAIKLCGPWIDPAVMYFAYFNKVNDNDDVLQTYINFSPIEDSNEYYGGTSIYHPKFYTIDFNYQIFDKINKSWGEKITSGHTINIKEEENIKIWSTDFVISITGVNNDDTDFDYSLPFDNTRPALKTFESGNNLKFEINRIDFSETPNKCRIYIQMLKYKAVDMKFEFYMTVADAAGNKSIYLDKNRAVFITRPTLYDDTITVTENSIDDNSPTNGSVDLTWLAAEDLDDRTQMINITYDIYSSSDIPDSSENISDYYNNNDPILRGISTKDFNGSTSYDESKKKFTTKISNLTLGTTYYFGVKVNQIFKQDLLGDVLISENFYQFAEVVIGPPSIIETFNITYSFKSATRNLTLTWDPIKESSITYQIYYHSATDDQLTSITNVIDPANTTYWDEVLYELKGDVSEKVSFSGKVPDLMDEGHYYYYIVAQDTSGYQALYPNPVEVIIDMIAPTILNSSEIKIDNKTAKNTFKLSWNSADDENAITYNIYYSSSNDLSITDINSIQNLIDSEKLTKINDLNVITENGTSNCEVTISDNGYYYYFYVVAQDLAGNIVVYDVSPEVLQGTPIISENKTISAQKSIDSLYLTWFAAENAEDIATNYLIEVSINNSYYSQITVRDDDDDDIDNEENSIYLENSLNSTIGRATDQTCTAVIKGLEAEQTYDFQIIAEDSYNYDNNQVKYNLKTVEFNVQNDLNQLTATELVIEEDKIVKVKLSWNSVTANNDNPLITYRVYASSNSELNDFNAIIEACEEDNPTTFEVTNEIGEIVSLEFPLPTTDINSKQEEIAATIQGLTSEAEYSFYVIATGNISSVLYRSNPIKTGGPKLPDDTKVTVQEPSLNGNSLKLTCPLSSEEGVTYKIYYSTEEILVSDAINFKSKINEVNSPIISLDTTSLKDKPYLGGAPTQDDQAKTMTVQINNLKDNQNYYFHVLAFDTVTNASMYKSIVFNFSDFIQNLKASYND